MKKKEVKFKPMNSYILVYAPKVSDKTEAGIIKSDAMIKEEKNKQDWFLEVAAIADNITEVKVGDKVFIGNGKLPAIEIDGEQYIYVNVLFLVGKRI